MHLGEDILRGYLILMVSVLIRLLPGSPLACKLLEGQIDAPCIILSPAQSTGLVRGGGVGRGAGTFHLQSELLTLGEHELEAQWVFLVPVQITSF